MNMVWAPDSPDLWAPDLATPNRWAPDSEGHLTLGRAVDLFLAAKAAEGGGQDPRVVRDDSPPRGSRTGRGAPDRAARRAGAAGLDPRASRSSATRTVSCWAK